ncbi:MAG: PKD domain-containing protein [Bacteroidota bacterium]
MSIQITPPKNISICGLNDTANIQVYNISGSTVSGLQIKLILPPGTFYIKGSVKGTGLSESNVTNLNQPIFNGPNVPVANNFAFRISLTAGCGLYSYISGNNSPVISSRIDYTGNYDVGTSLPFSAKVPSILISTIVNQTFTGNVGDVFTRTITIGNYGKGPLRTLTLLRVNGKDLKTYGVNKGKSSFKNDSVITVFSGADFKLVGNLDTFLDQNETIILTDSSRINGCKFLTTSFDLYWGCFGSICQVVKNSGIALIGSQSPNIVAFATAATPVCFDNKTNSQLLKVTNNGQKPAFKTRVYIDQGYIYDLSKLDTSTVLVKTGWKGTWVKPIIDSAGGNYNAGIFACLGANPIGSFRLALGTINPKDTVYISFKNYTCISTTCNSYYYQNSWMYATEFYDQCDNIKKIPMVWGKYYDLQSLTSSAFTPTDIVNNQKGEFRHLFTGFYTLNSDATASYLFDIIVPSGLTHNLNSSDFYIDNANLTATWKPDSIRKFGDTIRGFFSKMPFSMINSELIYYLKADCSAAGANGAKTVQLRIRNSPSKSCSPREWYNLYCYSMSLKIHCISTCSQGLRFVNFNVQRTSYGRPDNNNDGLADTGKVDLLKIREERALTGDTISAVFQGLVLRPRATVAGWRYLYAESFVYYGNYLDIIDIDLEVYNGSRKRIIKCNSVSYQKIISGVNATFKFDLSVDSLSSVSCAASSYVYKQNDSVSLRIRYKLTKNLGLASVTTQFTNLFYSSDVSKPTNNSNKFQCDTFSGQVILTGYQFLNYGPGTYAINSCTPIDIGNSFYLGIGANSAYAGNNYFPFEYRSFARLKEVIFYMPNGFKFLKADLGQYRTSGSNQYTWEWKDSIKQVLKNGNYTFQVAKYYKDSAKGIINFSDDAFQGNFNARIQPSCELPPGVNVPISYDFVFERRGSLGSGFDTVNSSQYGHDQVLYNKPAVSIKPAIPVNYATKDTAEWEIIYTNSSSSFSTVNCWFSPDNSGSVKIVDIRDANKDTSLKQVNGIYKAGIVGNNLTRKFKVKAIYNSCKKDSVILYSGWNCTDYPKDFPSYTCVPEKTVLYIEPQNTQFQVSISDSITTADLCAQSPYYYLLENIGATNAQNTKAQLTLPVGMTVVNGKSYIKHPHTTSWAALPAPKLTTGTTYEWDLSKLVTSLSKGFKGITDTTSNKILIKFYVKTDCNYSSGNYIRAGAAANIKCGDKVLIFPAISNPLNITGVTKPYYSLLKIVSDSILPCEKSTRVKVKIINLGPSKTGIEDKYQALFIPGMNYDSTMFKPIRNSPDNTLTTKRDINGATEVEFSLPSDIMPGDSIEFETGFSADNQLISCGTAELYSQAAVKQEVICVADNSKCKINVVTGNQLIKIPVAKSDITLSNLKTSLQSMTLDSEKITVSFILKNNANRIISGKSTKLSFYYDINNSGTADNSDLLLQSYTMNNAIEKGATIPINALITIKAGYSCALFVRIDSSSCACTFNQYRLPIPRLMNAGNDVSFCSKDDNKLGMPAVNGFTYSWQPATELNSDTISQPKIIFENTGAKKITRQYILTTKRLTCVSRDTVIANIYQLPKIKLYQGDTTVCKNQKVLLNAFPSNGSGIMKTTWSPASQVVDYTKSFTVSTTPQTTRYVINVVDSFGCKAKDSMLITAKPYPKSNFTFKTGCYGKAVLLTDSSYITQDSIKTNRWINGLIDTLNSKTWSVFVPLSLSTNVRLISESPYRCKDTITKSVTVKPYPKADFTYSDVCYGDTAVFTNASSITQGTITNYNWYFGDSKTATTADTKHRYGSADTFTVSLSTKSAFNCTDSVAKNIVVNNVPVAGFTFNDVCFGDSTYFKSTSTVANDSITGYLWTFDNVGTDTKKDPTFLFNTVGRYNIRLDVRTAFGCSHTTTGTNEIFPLPKAMILLDTVCEGMSNTFIEKSTVASGSLASRKWQLRDGYTSTATSFTHRFNTGDTFGVNYLVISNKGCRDSTTGFAKVFNKLIPVIQVNDNCLKVASNFNDLSYGTNTSVKSRWWKFTANDSSSAQNPAFTFPTEGKRNITLTVTSTEGCTYDTNYQHTVYPLPILNFANANQCKDNTFDFVATKSIAFGSIDSLRWDFGDGSSANTDSVKHSFPAAGNYTVAVYGISDFGCVDSVKQTINSYPPVLVMFSNDSVCLGNPTTFNDLCQVPNATITKYRWTFGDGQNDNIANPLHTYSLPGTYPVTLKITTSYNCVYDTAGLTTVFPVPVSAFSVDKDEMLITNPVFNFMDLSTGADSIRFHMGDGQYLSSPQFKYTYKDTGLFNVKHWAYNDFGCIDSSNKKIAVLYTITFHLPSGFSPNNDGINDYLQPVGIGIVKYEMSVFNRWGELIYNTDKSESWDGKYQGDYVPNDAYMVTYKVWDYRGRQYFFRSMITVLR